MGPKVTIAIPTFNRAGSYLSCAIDCALAQGWPNLEVIVSDNCSSDNTSEIVASYSDSRLKYVRQERNIGPNNNFNYCVSIARGDYFLLFHDDDIIDNDIISTCMEAAEGRTDFGVIRTGTRLIGSDGRLIREIPNLAAELDYKAFFRGWMQGSFTSYVCSTLFNTSLLRRIGGFQSHHGLFQDLIAVAKLISRSGHCDVKEVKASFRRHDENYGNAADLKAWCEDGVQLAEVIAAESPSENEALYEESMKYLCWTVYRYADRFLPDPAERLKAYRMIDAEFGYRYRVHKFIVDEHIKKRYRSLDRRLRNSLKLLIGSDVSA